MCIFAFSRVGWKQSRIDTSVESSIDGVRKCSHLALAREHGDRVGERGVCVYGGCAIGWNGARDGFHTIFFYDRCISGAFD